MRDHERGKSGKNTSSIRRAMTRLGALVQTTAWASFCALLISNYAMAQEFPSPLQPMPPYGVAGQTTPQFQPPPLYQPPRMTYPYQLRQRAYRLPDYSRLPQSRHAPAGINCAINPVSAYCR